MTLQQTSNHASDSARLESENQVKLKSKVEFEFGVVIGKHPLDNSNISTDSFIGFSKNSEFEMQVDLILGKLQIIKTHRLALLAQIKQKIHALNAFEQKIDFLSNASSRLIDLEQKLNVKNSS